jgi:hypothetical protein
MTVVVLELVRRVVDRVRPVTVTDRVSARVPSGRLYRRYPSAETVPAPSRRRVRFSRAASFAVIGPYA